MYLNGFLVSTWMRDTFLLMVKSNGRLLCGSDYTNDKEIVMAAVKSHGHALYYASDDLKADKEVVMAALRNAGSAIQFASDALQYDHEVIKESFKNNMYALFYDHVRNNKELVLAAVSQMGSAIHYIPRHYLHDRDIICAAVKENGNVLHFFEEDPMLLFYAKHSKHPKKLTPFQEENLATFINQKNKEKYNSYLIKTYFSGHELDVFTTIQTFI